MFSPQTPPKGINVYLIRHTSVNVPTGTCYGQTDVPLCEKFPEEAKKVKINIQELTFDAVYTSPLTRCVQLANYCGYPNAQQEDRLKELNFGEWEMTHFSTLTGKEAQAWFNNWINVRTPNGESLKDQYTRVSAFLEHLKTLPLTNVCLFTHGGVITCARAYASQYPLTEAFNHLPAYGEIIKLTL